MRIVVIRCPFAKGVSAIDSHGDGRAVARLVGELGIDDLPDVRFHPECSGVSGERLALQLLNGEDFVGQPIRDCHILPAVIGGSDRHRLGLLIELAFKNFSQKVRSSMRISPVGTVLSIL